MTFPRKNTLQPLALFHSLQGKKIQTVSTPPLQFVFFSFGPPVGRKKKEYKISMTSSHFEWTKTSQTFKTAPKNDSTDPIDRPNKTHLFSNSTRTFYFLTGRSKPRLGAVKKPDLKLQRSTTSEVMIAFERQTIPLCGRWCQLITWVNVF